MLQLDHINLVVRDMDAMSEFYRRLGLSIEMPPPEWAPHHRSSASDVGAEVHLDSEQFTRVWNRFGRQIIEWVTGHRCTVTPVPPFGCRSYGVRENGTYSTGAALDVRPANNAVAIKPNNMNTKLKTTQGRGGEGAEHRDAP